MKRKFITFITLLVAANLCSAGEERIRLKAALESFRAEYSAEPNHKAFAQSPEGAWAWSSNRAYVQDAKDDAIIQCTKNIRTGESPCVIINLDGKWIPNVPLDHKKLAADAQNKRDNAEQVGIISLKDENIKSAIEASKGRLAIHFSSYDSGCGYCVKSNEPIEKMVPLYRDNVKFARITWEPWTKMNQKVIGEYNLYGLPAVIIFNNGKEEARIEGWKEGEIREKLDACCKR